MSREPENLLSEWSRLVVGALAAAGVRRVVVSPGSRSTPYLIALAERGDVTLEGVVDERCAAFVALGMARAAGESVALLTTSGTAPAHAYPAVIEADRSGVSLVILSADRPIGLRDSGAAQTIDQSRLFGAHARAFVEIGDPSAHPEALRHARRAIHAAVETSRGPRPGAVQINLPARKPLEPRASADEAGRALRAEVDALLEAPPVAAARPRIIPDTASAARTIERARRPIVVVGPLPSSAASDGTRDAIFALARRLGAPIYAEASSQLRFGAAGDVSRIDALDLLLRVPSPAREADLFVEIGAPSTSMGLDRHLSARPEVSRVRFEAGWARDPHATAEAVVVGDLAPTLVALAGQLAAQPASDAAWRERLEASERAAWEAVARGQRTFGESAVARVLVDALPGEALLSVGNSLPIRALDRAARSRTSGPMVLHQRGANGIDGLVSGAAGASLATARPHALLLGDLSFQHDVGGLAVAAEVRSPLAIVVVQNSGGRIFEQLPLGRDGRFEWLMPRVITPQRFEPAHAARAFGVEYARAIDVASLEAALAEALTREGATVVEAVVPPSGYRDEEARILAALEALLPGDEPR